MMRSLRQTMLAQEDGCLAPIWRPITGENASSSKKQD
jgi:hypothetical protein